MMIRDHILFRNKKGIFETQFTFLSMSLSIMDMLVILLGVIISLVTFNIMTGGSRNFTAYQALVAMAPVAVTFLLVAKNQPIVPMYVTVFGLFSLKKEKKDIKVAKRTAKKSKSSVLGFAEEYEIKRTPEQDIPMEYQCDDLNKPKRLKVTLFTKDGNKFADSTVKAYLNDILLDTVKTSLDGELELYITPRTFGKKSLVLKDESNNIVYTKDLVFLEKTTF